MDTLNWDAWLDPFRRLGSDVAAAAPRIGASLLLLAFGFAVAVAARALLRKVLPLFKADERLSQYWLFRFWRRSHRGQSPSEGLANTAFYGFVLLALLLAVRALGDGLGQDVLNSLFGMFPRVLSVILILLVSGLLASFVSLLVQMVLAGSDLPHAVFWGKVAAWATFGSGLVLSLEPLGLAGQLLEQVLIIVLASAGLAGALAFGLGCKDLAREFLLELLQENKSGKDEV